jgi:hypothetical protein
MNLQTTIIAVALLILTLFARASMAADAEVFDDQTPLDVLKQAATNGNPNAQFFLAERIIHGQAVSPPEQRALDESQQELAAALNSLEWRHPVRARQRSLNGWNCRRTFE